VRDSLEKHGYSKNRLGAGSAIELSDEMDVGLLLDLLEGLYYEADFTGERRRADRYSVRV
jgi:hypothetical protein